MHYFMVITTGIMIYFVYSSSRHFIRSLREDDIILFVLSLLGVISSWGWVFITIFRFICIS